MKLMEAFKFTQVHIYTIGYIIIATILVLIKQSVSIKKLFKDLNKSILSNDIDTSKVFEILKASPISSFY